MHTLYKFTAMNIYVAVMQIIIYYLDTVQNLTWEYERTR